MMAALNSILNTNWPPNSRRAGVRVKACEAKFSRWSKAGSPLRRGIDRIDAKRTGGGRRLMRWRRFLRDGVDFSVLEFASLRELQQNNSARMQIAAHRGTLRDGQRTADAER